MKVKELIKELKKMPQDLPVGVAMHDNNVGEIAGNILGAEEGYDNFDPDNKIKMCVLYC